SPEMWRAQRTKNVLPLMDSIETANVFAYFFSLAYFKTPGNANSGRIVFEAKGCAQCHDTSAAGRRAGPPISTWSEVNDPLAWAERMWNHSETVYRDTASRGLSWPQFSTTEMLDLLAYLRAAPESRSRTASFQPGNPEQGLVIFEQNC